MRIDYTAEVFGDWLGQLTFVVDTRIFQASSYQQASSMQKEQWFPRASQLLFGLRWIR